MSTTSAPAVTPGFVFNRDYYDLEQVADHIERYRQLRQEMIDAGRYPYNDAFRGQIPGIAGPDEDTAIYLLSGLLSQREQDARVAACSATAMRRSQGRATWSASATSSSRRPAAWAAPGRSGGTRASSSARARSRGVLPNGKRTCGVLRMGRAVPVLR
jgi:hypothetical protein